MLPPVQAGVTLHRLLQEYGHCVIARELFEGAPNFDSLIEFAESITGQVRRPRGFSLFHRHLLTSCSSSTVRFTLKCARPKQSRTSALLRRTLSSF